MANNQIGVQHTSTAKTVYAVARNLAGEVARQNTVTCVTYATANLANYAISLTEQGTASRYYAGTFLAFPAGSYDFAIFEQVGGSPAETDTLIGTGGYEWDGTAFMSLAERVGGMLNDGSEVMLLKRLVIENDTSAPAFYVHNSANGNAVKFLAESINSCVIQTNGVGGCISLHLNAPVDGGNALYCYGDGDAGTFYSNAGHGFYSRGGTDKDGFHGVGSGTGYGFSSMPDANGFGSGSGPDATAIAEAILKLDLSTISGEAAHSLINAVRKLRNHWAIVDDVLTVYKEDGSTPAYTQTLTLDVAAIPITGIGS